MLYNNCKELSKWTSLGFTNSTCLKTILYKERWKTNRDVAWEIFVRNLTTTILCWKLENRRQWMNAWKKMASRVVGKNGSAICPTIACAYVFTIDIHAPEKISLWCQNCDVRHNYVCEIFQWSSKRSHGGKNLLRLSSTRGRLDNDRLKCKAGRTPKGQYKRYC